MIGVAIPARDECTDIEDALQAVGAALGHPMLSHARRMIVVANDDSCDGTGHLARRVLRGRGEVLEGAFGSAGGARKAAVDRLVELAGRLPPEGVWIATTDADSRVSGSWLAGQVQCWCEGADAVAGMVTPMWDARGQELLRRSYEAMMADLGAGSGHSHVFGANLGFTAQTYAKSGGLLALESGEDHALWKAFGANGACLVSVADDPVATSARLVGRAPDGFASLLAHLSLEEFRR